MCYDQRITFGGFGIFSYIRLPAEDYTMILQSGISSGRRIAWETTGTSLPGAGGPQVSPEERSAAAEKMRHELYMNDPCERRMSIEDCVDAILERKREGATTELPA